MAFKNDSLFDVPKIGLTGRVRSGKNTVADYLEKVYHMSQFALGDKLKENFHKDHPHILWKPKPVRGYQLYGQLKRYVYGDDYWTEECFKEIAKHEEIYNTYREALRDTYPETEFPEVFTPVITDIRQPNEIERCKQEGFVIIRITCDQEIQAERLSEVGDKISQSDLNFETETWIDKFDVDYEIENNGTLEQLHDNIDSIIQHHIMDRLRHG